MSTFREALFFFERIGIYDVVLPFLLIFTLVFAMLEKTEVLGSKNPARKNLSAMVAFVSAFLVVASAQLVATINRTIAMTMVVLVMIILMMLVWGSFQKSGEAEAPSFYKNVLMVVTFLSVALILLWNLGWLQTIYAYTSGNLTGPVVGSVLLLIIVVGFMYWIYNGGQSSSGGSAEKKG
jgi:small-conductance mechanosensitive channel